MAIARPSWWVIRNARSEEENGRLRRPHWGVMSDDLAQSKCHEPNGGAWEAAITSENGWWLTV